jgi:SsrA-binding protein
MTIADNKKAFFDYFIEERYEAGIVLKAGRSRRSAPGASRSRKATSVRDAEMF